MSVQDDQVAQAEPARRPGRRRDDTRDDAILDAARALLVERGYENMTMDAVAEKAGAGKATLYRRWSSKTALVVDAITCHRFADLTVDDIPDTGSLRGDLLEVHRAKMQTDTEALMVGLAAAVRDDPQVASAFQRRFVQARTGLMRALFERASLRGEIPSGRDLDMIATVAPAMISYHKITSGRPLDPDFVVRLIDTVIVPLATWSHPGETHGR